MSNELDIFQQGSTAVAHARRDDGFTANITGSSVTAKRISIRGSKFRDRKSTRLNSSHIPLSRMPSSA